MGAGRHRRLSAPRNGTCWKWVADMARGRRHPGLHSIFMRARNQAVMGRTGCAEGSLLARLERFGLVGPGVGPSARMASGSTKTNWRVSGAAGAKPVAFNPASNLKPVEWICARYGQYADAGAGLAIGCDNCSGNDAQSLFPVDEAVRAVLGACSPTQAKAVLLGRRFNAADPWGRAGRLA